MRFILLFLSAGAFQIAFSQIVIKHDLQNQKTRYFKVEARDTLALKKLKVKDGDRLTLEVENFNPFYYAAKVTAVKEETDNSGSTNVFNPFSILANSLGNSFSAIPDLNLPSVSSRGNGNSAIDRYISNVSQFKKAYERFQSIVDYSLTLQIVESELTSLKFDATRSENETKSAARKLVEQNLQLNSLEIEDAITIGARLQKDLNRVIDSAIDLASDIVTRQPDVPTEINGINTEKVSINATMGLNQLNKTKQQVVNNKVVFTDQLLKITKLYKEIENTHFQFLYSVDDASQTSTLKLKVYPKSDSIFAQDTIIRYFPVARRKTLALRNSVGLAFSFFGDKGRSFYLSKDSIIGSEKGNAFVPVLSTFIHFFPNRNSSFKVGGSFGFGIPITDETNKNVNFLLGLNLIFGSNEPIFITLGVDGAKTTQLSQGYKVGLKSDQTNIEKITRSYYNIGGFLSVSFNLTSLTTKKN